MSGHESLSFPESDARKLEAYLPDHPELERKNSGQGGTVAVAGEEAAAATASLVPPPPERGRPFVTLTFATSLDSSLSLAPGMRTALSGPQSKAMTHHLRSRHEAICVGVGTAMADDPALNCRIAGAIRQPRPIVLDPHARWDLTRHSKVLERAREGKGLAPFVLTGLDVLPPAAAKAALVEEHGGKFVSIELDESSGRFRWADVLAALHAENIGSVMIEGGGGVINSLLEPSNHDLIDSVIVTIAPTWLGRGGVVVSPDRRHEGGVPVPAARLRETAWIPLGEDVVLCGKL